MRFAPGVVVSPPSESLVREHVSGVVDEYHDGDWMDAFLTIYQAWCKHGYELEKSQEYRPIDRAAHHIATNQLRVMVKIMREKGLIVDDSKYSTIVREYLSTQCDNRPCMDLPHVDMCRLFGDGISDVVGRVLQHAINEVDEEIGQKTIDGENLMWIGQGRDDIEVAALNLLEFALGSEKEALLQSKPHLFVDVNKEVH